MVGISVLLYVYNCGNFLKDSLDSVINQSFHDFEIFCINDESEDNSLEILEEYSKKDNRIRFITIKHLGFSKAMNHAFSLIDGKYIYIMKPSSYLKVNALDILFKQAEETNADLIFSDINYQYDNSYYNKSDSMQVIHQNIGKKVFNHLDLKNLIFYIDASLENKFYSLDFIKRNNLIFYEGLSYPEHLFFYNSLLFANNISFINEFLFDYIKPFEFLEREKIILEDIFEEYNLILNSFREINYFDYYKYNFLELKLSFFMREYGRIKEDYKSYFFNIFRRDLIDIFLSDDFEDKSVEVLSNFNRKIFEHVLISENIYEFELLRKNLFITTEFNASLDRKAFLKSVSNY